MRKKHGHLGLETPLGLHIPIFLNFILRSILYKNFQKIPRQKNIGNVDICQGQGQGTQEKIGLSMVRDPIRVTCTNFFKCHIKNGIMHKFLQNTMKKNIGNADILARKGLKIAKIRRNCGCLGLTTQLVSRNLNFGSAISRFMYCLNILRI